MTGALDGIRVIDFGQYISGPMAAMLLGDQGADVIRVDPCDGPRWNTPANATWNRNKRSIALDLKDESDLQVAKDLIASADIVIENFRTGVMDRLGIGSDAMTATHPRLLYCALPGFAADDPRSGVAAWEGVVASATATYRAHERTGKPVYTAIPIGSIYVAFQTALAVSVALNARERDGVGQQITIPLYDGTFAAMGNRVLQLHDQKTDPNAARLRMARGVGGQLQGKDGRWVMYMGGNLNARDFLEASGAAAWVDAAADGKMTADEVRAKTEELFRSKTAQEWEDFVAEVGSECGRCNTPAEWLVHPHALESEIIVDTDDPELGKVRGPGINVRMSATPGSIRSPRHKLDADRDDILSELRSWPAGAAPNSVEGTLRAAFDGLKVLDLCIVLAGPACGRTLAEFGADVIKVDATNRPIGGFHNDVNRGKRSILVDLKTKEGLELFLKLVDQADVLVQNYRNGVAKRLGFDYEAIKARKPEIIYATLNAFGQVGPYADRPGHEQIGQAVAGMQERFGGTDKKPVLQPFAVNDYGTGIMGAYAIALALFHRQKTGVGQHVDTSLVYTATMLQSSLIQDYKGKVWDEPRGQHMQGSGPLHRAYEASDGWFFLGATKNDLAESPDLNIYAGMNGELLEGELEALFKTAPMSDWIEKLGAAGAGVHRIIFDPHEVAADPWVLDHGLCMTREHDEIGQVTTNGPSIRLSRTPAGPGHPAPKAGSDIDSVLAELGLSDQLEQLLQYGAISRDFLPQSS